MIQEIGDRQFDNAYIDRPAQDADRVFVFCGKGKADDRILLFDHPLDQSNTKMVSLSGGAGIVTITEVTAERIPTVGRLKKLEADLGIKQGSYRYLFCIDEDHYYLYEENDVDATRAYSISIFQKFMTEESLDCSFEKVVALRSLVPMDLALAGMTAYHLFCWYRDSLHCGRCGGKTFHHPKMRAVQCTECGNLIFPRILPAVIIGVKNGDKLLMSQYAGREYKGRALLAGFIEIGETAEHTVVREVLEEVGLKVKNVTYYGTQPWGYDMDLLLGYFAELDGDDQITLDEDELARAAFVPRDEIDPIYDHKSLTADMIEAFRSGKVK